MNDLSVAPGGDAADDARFGVSVSVTSANYAEITCSGRFDAVVTADVRARLLEPDVASFSYLVFDLSEVTFLDSAGLAVLVRSRRDCMLRDGNVVVVGPRSTEAHRVFELTQFDQIFIIVDHREDA